MQHSNCDTDVIIIGGGLAGLTLALQLKQSSPELTITVVERNRFPIPEKTAKVGESTVELGSYYLKETLKQAQHFDKRHLRKHGLRCFFGYGKNEFSDYDELGVSQLFGIPTYQIDRGAIENHLHHQLLDLNVNIIDGVSVVSLEAETQEKSVTVAPVDAAGGTEIKLSGKWLLDTAGRQNFLKSKLDLVKSSSHKGNAVWFRIDKQVKLDQWSSNESWKSRILEPETRWLSTNHLMGPGYWVWIIPLDNGATSFGIVGDNQVFEDNDFSSFETTKAWLEKKHPHCAAEIENAKVLDFVSISDYSHSCKQVFSDDCWGISGEAGLFADPFYSPGTDFIALSNTFLTQLVSDQHRGKDIRLTSRVYEQLYQSFFASTLSLYEGQYGGFGDRRMMSLKLVWDYAYYWGILTLLFYRNATTDIQLMRKLSEPLRKAQQSNQHVQSAFRQHAMKRQVLPAQGIFMNQYDVPCLKHFNAILDQPSNSIEKDLSENTVLLERLAGHIVNLLSCDSHEPLTMDEQELLGDYRHVVLA